MISEISLVQVTKFSYGLGSLEILSLHKSN